MSLARGMWGPHTDFMGVLNHVGAVVRLLIQDPAVPNVAIGAFVAVWIDHATARADMQLPALQLTAHIALCAVAAEKLPILAARRLWNFYFGVVEAVLGTADPKAYGLALARVALQAGAFDNRMAKEHSTPQSTLGERLMMGLEVNSDAWIGFAAAYTQERN
jgi:hypothetical protein